MEPFSKQLLFRQLVLLGRVAHAAEGSMLRNSFFLHGSLVPQTGCYVRRVGRPRQEWCSQVMRQGGSLLGHGVSGCVLRDRTDGAQQRWIQKLREELF